MTEATAKQTPKASVLARVDGAYLHTREDGRKEIRHPQTFQPIGDSATTPLGAWKNAAEAIDLDDRKQKQADDFNRQASKPTPPAPKASEKPAPKIGTISRKEREKRRNKRRQASKARQVNRRRCA